MAQGRPRFSTAGGFARAYDPAKSRDYKDYIRLAAAEQVKGQAPLDGALIFGLKVYRAIPKGFSKKKADAAERGEIRPITKPDIDNYVKGIKDALRSICWHDDSQIVAYKEPFGKYYSEKPRIEIEVETIKADALVAEIRDIFADDDRLEAICQAELDGRVVVLPCKVGTRVWVIGHNCDLCRDMYAEEPCLFGSCEYKEVFESVFGYGMIDNFGKTVFLTREEAEEALKGAGHE